MSEASSAMTATAQEDGATATQAEQLRTFETLPDIASKFRGMAADLGAGAFRLFAIGPAGRGDRLALLMDTDFPGGETASALPFAIPDALADRLATSNTVLWWEGTSGTVSLGGFSEWSEQVAVRSPSAGLAFPLCSERGQPGAAIFSGARIAAEGNRLTEMHARCYHLFGIVSDIRPAEGHALPVVSRRELECLKLTASGLTSDDIARHLGLSVHTANQYLANTVQKLDAVNRAHAVAKAIRMGLIG